MEKIRINNLLIKAFVPKDKLKTPPTLSLGPYIVDVLKEFSEAEHIQDMYLLHNHQYRIINRRPVLKGVVVQAKRKLLPLVLGPRIGNGVLVYELSGLTVDNITFRDFLEVAREKMNFDFSGKVVRYMVDSTTIDNFMEKIQGIPGAKENSNILNNNTKIIEESFNDTIGKGHHFIEIRYAREKTYLIIHAGASKFSSLLFSYYSTKTIKPKIAHELTSYLLKSSYLGSDYILDLSIATLLGEAIREQQAQKFLRLLGEVTKKDFVAEKIFDRSYIGIEEKDDIITHYNGAYPVVKNQDCFYLTDICSSMYRFKIPQEWIDKGINFAPAYSGNKYSNPIAKTFTTQLRELNQEIIIHNIRDSQQDYQLQDNFHPAFRLDSLYPFVTKEIMNPKFNIRSEIR